MTDFTRARRPSRPLAVLATGKLAAIAGSPFAAGNHPDFIRNHTRWTERKAARASIIRS
jgi:hypothetical protein